MILWLCPSIFTWKYTSIFPLSIDQTKGLDANRHRVKTTAKPNNSGPAAMFLVVLEGMVYTVGAIFAAAALYLGRSTRLEVDDHNYHNFNYYLLFTWWRSFNHQLLVFIDNNMSFNIFLSFLLCHNVSHILITRRTNYATFAFIQACFTWIWHLWPIFFYFYFYFYFYSFLHSLHISPLGMRWYKGQSVPFMNVFNPDSQVSNKMKK